MKRALLLALLAPLSARGQAPAEKPDYSKLKVDKLFETLCSSCHGKNLEGGQGTSLIDGEWKHGGSEAEIFQTILKGNVQLGMTPWEGVLGNDQIRSLVIFIKEKEKAAKSRGIVYPKPEPGKVTRTDRESYRIEMVVEDGLRGPWALAFLPDGRKLITEVEGRLRILGANNQLDPRPVEGIPKVIRHGQGGLMEVAVHPDYATNGWIYLAFADGWREGDPEKGSPRTLTAVVRGRIKDHQWVDQEWIFQADKKFYTNAGVHFGTRIVFDQGYLYFVVGERGGRMEAQDITRPNGKIYRLHDDGRVPADNPFVGKPDAIGGIWSFGHRNPQGLARDPADGSLYDTEHGPRGGDELNWIQKGHNYGWPVITYGMDYDGSPISDKTAQEGMDQPVTYWVPSIAACGLDFYTGDAFPQWKGDAFAGALAQQEIRRLRLKDHQVTEQEIVLKNIGRVRDVTSGPDGFLYVTLNGPDRIVRLVPAEEK